jgi:hypothetical protein
MSNFLYDNARKNFAMGNIKWMSSGGDTFMFFFVDSQYTADVANDETLAHLPSQYRYGRTGQAFSDGFELIINDPMAGICDAQDLTITGIQAGLSIGSIIIYKLGTSDLDSLLIVNISMGSGMPFITDGSDIHMEWSNAYTRLFRI